ncbi:helix-turn-helix domain-containing protein [Flavobacterium sp.]|uniref:helix-turn-helix transcriptional regulator n=1 Tax=Flavobacterium sp. TaxID=239 RepID=UPI00286C0597|nr:helix-turn-helix domain-containing protein [Flavobacterium sp.]
MEHQKLITIRKTKGITQEQMAKKIPMEQTTYSRKERGKSPISNEEWARIAKTLEVSVEEIKDENIPIAIKNENCTFNDNAIGIQYVNIPQEVYTIVLKYNSKLEEENKQLKNELDKK